MATKPIEGADWNPLQAWPRNEPCFCGSGRKFKACHRAQLPPAIDAKKASQLRKFMADKRAGKKVNLIIENTQPPTQETPHAPSNPDPV